MKKAFIGIFLLLIAFVLIGCGSSTTSQTNATITNTAMTNTAITNVETTILEEQATTTTENPDEQKQAVQTKITQYINKISEITGNGNEVYEQAYQDSSNHLMLLMDGYTEINRADFPAQEVPELNQDKFDPEFLINLTEVLSEYRNIIDTIESFNKGEFYSIDYNSTNYYIKASVDGDLLNITCYNSYLGVMNSEPCQEVYTSIISLNTVDDQLILESVRDAQNNSGYHKIYYDKYVENGDMVNVAFEVSDHNNIYYQEFHRETGDTFSISHNEEGFGMNYFNSDNQVGYSLDFDQSNAISQYYIIYGYYNPSFLYHYSQGDLQLRWNLYDVENWNKAYISYDGSDAMIYKDDTEVLPDFDITINLISVEAKAEINMPVGDFNESVLDLSDYGLQFTDVTFQDIADDIYFVQNDYQTAITEYGLSLDMETNYEILYNMVFAFPDEAIITNLFAAM